MQQLQAIQERVEQEGDEDKGAHGKLACWCKTNLEEKGKSVDGMKDQLSRLGSDVEAQSAQISRLEAELKEHAQDISENQDSLNKAKALRENAAKKFAQDEANHVANLDTLDGALNAVAKGSGIDAALVVVRQVTRRPRGARQGRRMLALVQEGDKLSAASSPEVVYGVLKRMHATFSEDLEDMRVDEADQNRRHEDLVAVKENLMGTLQKQLESKKMQLANAKVQITQRQSQDDKSQQLLQVNMQLVAAMSQFCEGSDRAFEERLQERRAETQALAEARAEQANVGLLQGSSAQIDVASINPAAEELCVAALGVAEGQWRDRAKAACEKARAGKAQDAADEISQLQSEIEEAAKAAADDKEKCRASLQDAQAAAEQSAKEESTKESALNSDMSDIDAQIADVSGQASSSDKAKSGLAEAQGAIKAVLQAIHTSSYNDVNHMQGLKARASATAAQKISQAQDHSQKLAKAASEYGRALESGAQRVTSLLIESTNAASKVMIPLRMMRADTEQDTLALNEDRKAHEHTSRPACDPSALAANETQLKGYASSLGKAAEGLAFDALR